MGYLTSLTAEERFFSKVDKSSGVYPDFSDPLVSLSPKDSGQCWIWKGGYNSNGYPRYSPKSGMGTIPYRIAWTYLKDDIPNGFHLDHLCRNPGCVNPNHLEPVTSRVNALRSNNPLAQNARKTHCNRGHPFTDENTIRDKENHRHCRICSRMSNTVWARNKRASMREEN